GAEGFNQLKKWTAFEWRLAQFASNPDREMVARSMLPLIVNEGSYITQEQMIKTLSTATGITERSLFLELDRLQNLRERKLSLDKQVIVDELKLKLDKDPNELLLHIREAE